MSSDAKKRLSRREFLRAAGLVAGAAALGGCAQPTPQVIEKEKIVTKEVEKVVEKVVTATPLPKPDKLNFCYWTVGGAEPAVLEILAKFEADYGMPVEWLRVPNIEEATQKVMSMFVSGDQLDMVVLHTYDVAKWSQEGIVQPVDGLPGLNEYLKEMAPSVRRLLEYDGHYWGLPYFIAVSTNAYNTVLLEQAGVQSLPTSWEEVTEISKKAKADGIAEYPIVFQAGVGQSHVSHTWFDLVGSVGGVIFDQDLNPILDEGSKARQMLKWWRDTIQEWEIADPRSLELRWIPAMKAYATGDYMFTNTQDYYMRYCNSPQESSTAGIHRILRLGTPLSRGHMWGMHANAYSREWAWRLIEYFGGKTKDGEYLFAKLLAKVIYTCAWPTKVLEDPEINALWKEALVDLDEYQQHWANSKYIGDVCPAMSAPWYGEWTDRVVVPNLQNCLAGSISADEAAGNIAKGAEELKKSA